MAQEEKKKIASILFSVCCDNDFGENVWWLTLVGSGVCHAWDFLSVSELFQVIHALLH